MEIPAASFEQVRAGRDGRWVRIEQDLCEVVKQLREIDDSLRVEWNEDGNFYAIFEVGPGNTRNWVRTVPADRLDSSLVERIRQIMHPSYSYIAEAEAKDTLAEREKDHRFEEEIGEKAERTAAVIRKQLGAKNKIVVPRAP